MIMIMVIKGTQHLGKKYTKQTKIKHNTKIEETIEKNLHYIIEGKG